MWLLSTISIMFFSSVIVKCSVWFKNRVNNKEFLQQEMDQYSFIWVEVLYKKPEHIYYSRQNTELWYLTNVRPDNEWD